MPCNSDHMEATPAEEYSRETAKLIVYVSEITQNSTQQWIEDAAESYYGMPGRSDELTSILCKTLTDMPEDERELIIYNAKSRQSRNLADWWERHQKIDAERLKAEQVREENERLRRQAAAKLTPEEIEALLK